MRGFPVGLLLFLFVFVLFGLTAPAYAVSKISATSTELLGQVEQYLNARKNFSARFLQGTNDGQVMTGTLLVSRPGRMNLTYDPPSKDFIIADGSFVYLWDGELGQHSTLPLGGSLAALILQKDIKLNGDVEVLSVKQESGQLELAVQYRKDPEQGVLTLRFEASPLQFLGWRVRDAQNHETTVTLQNVQENVVLAAQSFVFTPPQLGKNLKSDRATDN